MGVNPFKVGIGHTRLVTHEAPEKINAHPNLDCSSRVAVIHNGIIENFGELKQELRGKAMCSSLGRIRRLFPI